MNKYDLHIHTKECDKCAELPGSEIVRLYKNAGYDGIVITDHYFSLFFEWFKDEISMSNHKKIIERYLRGYYSAKNEGEKNGLTVLCGAEVRIDGTINDYLVYGLEEKDFYELPLLNRLKDVREIVDTLPDYSVVVQAHPFRDNMTVCNPGLFFGVEGYNGGTEEFRNELAKVYAKHYQKSLTSGSDFHGIHHLAKGGIATMQKIRTSSDLRNVLSSGEYFLIENGKISEE